MPWHFSYGLWQQANNVETYSLTNFVLFFILFLASREKPKWWLIGLLLGVGSGLNPTIVAVIPGILVIARSQRRRNNLTVRDCFAALAMTLLGFIAIYSYLPIRAATHPFVNWGDPVNWERITKHLFGAGLNIYEPETNSINGFTGQPIIFWESFLHYWHLAIFQFTPLLFPLVVIGAWQLFRKNVFAFSMLAAVALANILFVVLYYGGNQESWMITSWVVMAVWMGMGVDFVLLSSRDRSDGVAISHKSEIASSKTPRNDKLKIAVLALSLLPLIFWYPILDHSKQRFADDYAQILYRGVPQGSIIIGGGDFFNSLTAYTHEVTGERRDIIPITGNMFYIFPWYRENLRKNTDITISKKIDDLIQFKKVEEFTEAIDQLVEDNLTRAVFVTPLLLRDSVVAGTTEGTYKTKKYALVPHGLLLKVDSLQKPTPPDESLFQFPSYEKLPYYMERNYTNALRLLVNDYAVSLGQMGEYFLQNKDQKRLIISRSNAAGTKDL